jgi:N-acetylmuramoyl-L-alanine amidase
MNEVAQLFRAMGDLFDSKYYQRAIDSFQSLLREYPSSKYREDALLAVAQIQQEDLRDFAQAKKTYEQFLNLHPRSSYAAEVRASLEKLSAESAGAKSSPFAQPPERPDRPDRPNQNPKDRADRAERSDRTIPAVAPAAASNAAPNVTAKTISAERTPPASDTKQGSADDAPESRSSGPEVSRIRTWNADTYTRIVIDVGTKVKYQAARITGPDRIYFDIEGAKLSSALLHKAVELDGAGFLKTVRVAQYQSGVVRVVLEVSRVTDYSVFLLPDPYRLVVDVYGTSAAAEEAAHHTAPLPGPTTTTEMASGPSDKPAKGTPATKPAAKEKEKEKEAEKAADKPAEKSTAAYSPTPWAYETRSTPPTDTSANAATPEPAPATAAKKPTAAPEDAPRKTTASTASKESKPSTSTPSKSDASLSASVTPATPETLPLPSHPAWPKKSKNSKSAHDQAAEMGPPPVPDLTLDGQHSLTRALGLKIGRIVIDAGHGGHDTGTIGPTGLMEKDLCLDVALRLGKIIQQKLPSAEVVFTRADDTFIPLERRTEIANEAKADLFISVHANSSQDRGARGIETYYLNFTGSSDAMEVASRENALSANAVHDLQDIVKKIASNEKIEESRDLASMIQESLSHRMENINRGERNRGVRKAPFVVLIGADMPSALSEISFLSNPSDEQWLKKPDNRQRVADGLYRGIESYLQSTNSLTSNQIHAAAENFAGKVARTGNSQ